ncbi:beta-xylosidase, partial [Amycolatopsis rhizosphaerae]
MRSFGRRFGALLLAGILGAAVLSGCSSGTTRTQAEGSGDGGLGGGKPSAAPSSAAPRDVALKTGQPRESGGVVAAGGPGAPYNYGPTVMIDGGRTRMWWCSQYPNAGPPGDDIIYGEAASVDGPFTGPGGGVPPAVLSGNPGQFDGAHTCDPSVVKVNGTYYLYYTGAAGDHALGNAIGLATSADGITWTRSPGPIVTPSHDVHRDNLYGAGQPSVVFLDGWFYLMFTDTTGRAAGWNGAGQFVLRAKDPSFSSDVEALGDKGFFAVSGNAAPRTTSVVDAFSADLMWVDALNAFAIAHETQDGTTITFRNRDFTGSPYQPIVLPGAWREGPGLVRTPDGHAPVAADDPCGRVPIDLVRATVLG